MALMVDTIGGHPCNTKITRIALIRYMANFGFDTCDALWLRSLKPFVLYLPVLCRLPCRCFHHNNHVTRLSVKLTSCLSAIVTRIHDAVHGHSLRTAYNILGAPLCKAVNKMRTFYCRSTLPTCWRQSQRSLSDRTPRVNSLRLRCSQA